jgi:hypothetical protein
MALKPLGSSVHDSLAFHTIQMFEALLMLLPHSAGRGDDVSVMPGVVVRKVEDDFSLRRLFWSRQEM